MEVQAPPELPATIGGLALLALRCFLRRWLLYLGLSVMAYGADLAIEVLRPGQSVAVAIGNAILSSVAEAFLVAAVTIGVLGDATGSGMSTRGVLDRALQRWWAVAIVNVLLNLLVETTIGSGVLRLSPDNLFGLITLLYVALWAAVAVGTVVAAADTNVGDGWLVFYALNRGGALAFNPKNVLRTATIALVMLALIAAQFAATTALLQHGVASTVANAGGGLVVNAIVLAPFQAFVAAVSLDMARRITPNGGRT